MASAARPWIVRHEPWLVLLLGTLAFVSIPISLGYLGLSWDALNHHIYLGWSAEHPRFDRDYLAASYQAYQYPYLYWPFYKLAMAGVSGVTAGIVLSLLHAAALPPAWMIARGCIPGEDLFAAGMRTLAVALAFLSGAVLSLFDSTSNDLVAAIPLLWAYAVALRPVAAPQDGGLRAALLSGALAGISVAFKLSNGFLVLAVPLLWVLAPGTWRERATRVILGGVCVVVAFVLFYGYWGWQLWSHYGNPFYPLYDSYMVLPRDWAGWRR
jgi:hypothetical protein